MALKYQRNENRVIGLGKMGYNLALNPCNQGHAVVAFDRAVELTSQIAAESGIDAVNSRGNSIR